MLVIFDWDGTLIDSTEKIIRCMHAAVDDLNLQSRSDQQVREIIGLGLPEAIKVLFPDIKNDEADSVRMRYSAHFIEADKTPCHFFPGVMNVLDELKGRGHRLAVATGKSRKGLGRVLQNLCLEEFFDATRCADETRSKPHPLMLEQLLSELDTPVTEAVMVGDTEFDLEMACNAGVNSVAVSYGAHERGRLARYKPELIVDDLAELLDWVS